MTKHPTAVDANGDPIRPGDHVTVGPNPTYGDGTPHNRFKGGEVGYVEHIDTDNDACLYSEPDGGGVFLGYCPVWHLTLTPEATS